LEKINKKGELIMKSIDKLVCDCCQSEDCDITLQTENGKIYIDADGFITFSYCDEDDVGKNIKGLMKKHNITKDNLEIGGSCNECEDEATVMIHFEDGSIMEANEVSFIYAFMTSDNPIKDFIETLTPITDFSLIDKGAKIFNRCSLSVDYIDTFHHIEEYEDGKKIVVYKNCKGELWDGPIKDYWYLCK